MGLAYSEAGIVLWENQKVYFRFCPFIKGLTSYRIEHIMYNKVHYNVLFQDLLYLKSLAPPLILELESFNVC